MKGRSGKTLDEQGRAGWEVGVVGGGRLKA